MTAYGAVVSLKNTIEYILHSSHITLVDPSLRIIQPAYQELQPLQYILESLDHTAKSRSRKKVNALDGQIKDTLWGFEDLLESLLSQQLQLPIPVERGRRPSHLSILGDWLRRICNMRSGGDERERDALLFAIDLQCLRDDVASFIETIKEMKRNYIH